MNRTRLLTFTLLWLIPPASAQQPGPRARDLGIPLDGDTGPLNAITDVPGVAVGHVTLIRGTGKLRVGSGPVRTGVTAIFPRGQKDLAPVFAGWFSLNGNGEMTGIPWIEDYGQMLYPVTLTNTNSVGTVRDAVIEWGRPRIPGVFNCCLPVATETWDGDLNDIYGFHIKKEHAFAAFDSAKSGPVAEGNVGGGTGMQCLGFKGGIGTASRRLSPRSGGFTVGVLVQCNFGSRRQLRIAGIPVGREIDDLDPCYVGILPLPDPQAKRCPGGSPAQREQGSIIVVIATDAPLLPNQLRRVARRAALGIGRMGGVAGAGSGDLFLAFSTASTGAADTARITSVRMLQDQRIDPIYEATVQATEEAIINALLAAKTMTGANDLRVAGLPHDRLRTILQKYNRLEKPQANQE
ncbi:MAG TPA: P1 family peptidase [Gemmatimonadales bacterium]|nr:P1 family peptidase [Gemmatimonadales bacterium]